MSLIETAIVLAIIGLVVGGIWVAAATVNERMKTTRFVADVMQIVTGIRSYSSPQRWTGGAATQVNLNDELVTMGIAPSSWIVSSAAELFDPHFNLRVYAQVSSLSANESVRFKVEIEEMGGDMPLARCMAITTALYSALKNELPVRSTAPFANIMLVYGSTQASRSLTSAAVSFVSSSPCVAAGPGLWLITLYIPY